MIVEIISKPVIEFIEEHGRKIEDTEPLMRDLAGIMEEAVNYNFDTEGRGEWAPLSEVTQSRGREGGKILQDSRLLSGSVSSRYDSREAVAGTTDIRAATHQFGASQGEYGTTSRGAPIPWGDIPARPFVQLYDDDIDEMQEAAGDFFGFGGG